jgi:hypothetical protein
MYSFNLSHKTSPFNFRLHKTINIHDALDFFYKTSSFCVHWALGLTGFYVFDLYFRWNIGQFCASLPTFLPKRGKFQSSAANTRSMAAETAGQGPTTINNMVMFVILLLTIVNKSGMFLSIFKSNH